MLLLPIDYSKTKILSVKEKLLEGWNRHNFQRTGIHVSDTLMCKRQVCFQRLDNNPKLTEKTIRYFQNGLSWHHTIQNLLSGPEWEIEPEYNHKGVLK